MINKVIKGKNIDTLNMLIADENKNGWVVKQIFVCGDGGMLTWASGVYALLEKDGKRK